ncbi:MAG: hypothetical protein AAF986_11025 [Pseudomonadota bacterium]
MIDYVLLGLNIKIFPEDDIPGCKIEQYPQNKRSHRPFSEMCKAARRRLTYLGVNLAPNPMDQAIVDEPAHMECGGGTGSW